MTLSRANRRLTLRTATVLLALAVLVGFALLLSAAFPVSAAGGGPEKVPDTPERPEGTAIFIGGVDLEWDEVPGADSYEVQLFRNGQWIDLPGDGVEIAYYGAGAIISQLNHDGPSYWFQVRANNAKGSSEWSDPYLMLPTYHSEAGRKERPENVVATGKPTISGTAQVDEILTADASGIEDGNGLDRVKFQYQWVSHDGTTDTDIEGATESAYRLQAADEGKTLKVRGSFIDRHGYAESLTSAATPAALAAPPNVPPTGAPAISGPTHVSGTLTVSVQGIDDQNGLRHATFRYRWTATEGTTKTVVQDSENPIYVLAEADEGKTVQVAATFTDDDGYEETLLSVPTGAIGPRPNRPATGEPTIIGAPQVGETLTVDISGITDDDGLTNVSFSYQWLADDVEIAGATNINYTLATADVAQTIKVQVSFRDENNNPETLTGGPTAAVLAIVPGAPEHLNVSLQDTGGLDVSWEAPTSDGGSAVTGYRVQWKETAGSWDTSADVSEATVAGTTHTITGLTDGVEYTVRVIASNDVGDGPSSGEATGTPRETTPPELSTATVDGATLTLTYGEALDEASEPAADAFSVTIGGLERMVDGVAVAGDTVTLTLASAVTAEETVTVSYAAPADTAALRIRDLAGNAAASFSDELVIDNTPRPNRPATGQPTIEGTAQVGRR